MTLSPGRRREQQEREGEGAAEGVQAAARDEAASEADADALRLRADIHLLHQSAGRGKWLPDTSLQKGLYRVTHQVVL